MAFTSYAHDPDSRLDYTWDWADFVGDVSDTITDATVVCADEDITVADVSHTDTAVVAWISGGTASTKYTVTCHIVTAAGREEDRSITLSCKEK